MAKILLVDDDEDLAQTLAEVFEILAHAVRVLACGSEALEAMQAERFDAILLDWQLPDMTGLEVCRQYRQAGGRDKVLLLTGMRDVASKEAGKAAGANDFLSKPFTLDQLTERLDALLKSPVE